MKVWITRYLFTRGIVDVDGAEYWTRANGGDRSAITAPWPGGTSGSALFFTPDWQASEQAAKERAVAMIAAKRKRIAKQLDDLNKQLVNLDKLEAKLRGTP